MKRIILLRFNIVYCASDRTRPVILLSVKHDCFLVVFSQRMIFIEFITFKRRRLKRLKVKQQKFADVALVRTVVLHAIISRNGRTEGIRSTCKILTREKRHAEQKFTLKIIFVLSLLFYFSDSHLRYGLIFFAHLWILCRSVFFLYLHSSLIVILLIPTVKHVTFGNNYLGLIFRWTFFHVCVSRWSVITSPSYIMLPIALLFEGITWQSWHLILYIILHELSDPRAVPLIPLVLVISAKKHSFIKLIIDLFLIPLRIKLCIGRLLHKWFKNSYIDFIINSSSNGTKKRYIIGLYRFFYRLWK